MDIYAMNEFYLKLLKQHPFLAVVRYAKNDEYVCIIQNQNSSVTTIYDYGLLKTDQQRKDFLRLAEIWYWESNRCIPINIFLREEWSPFKFCAKSLITKEVEVISGNVVKLDDLSEKRTKRRIITLVKK